MYKLNLRESPGTCQGHYIRSIRWDLYLNLTKLPFCIPITFAQIWKLVTWFTCFERHCNYNLWNTGDCFPRIRQCCQGVIKVCYSFVTDHGTNKNVQTYCHANDSLRWEKFARELGGCQMIIICCRTNASQVPESVLQARGRSTARLGLPGHMISWWLAVRCIFMWLVFVVRFLLLFSLIVIAWFFPA